MCTYRGSSYLQFATMADITVMTLWVVPSCDDVYLPLLTLLCLIVTTLTD